MTKENLDTLLTEYYQQVEPYLTSLQKLKIIDIEIDDDGAYIEAQVEMETLDS